MPNSHTIDKLLSLLSVDVKIYDTIYGYLYGKEKVKVSP